MAKGAIFSRMLAIGVGLIGGSICLAAKKKGLAGHVLGYSRKLETAHEALKLGIVDECIAGPGDSNVRNVDVVVLSIPVRQYKQVLTQFLPSLPPNCLIFDAGSTKSDVALMLDELEPQFPGLKSRFVLSHPIAGGESHGPAAAVANLFEGRNCVLCPLPQTNPVGLKKVESFWSSIGAKLSTMNAMDHDEMFGAVSHLP
ncbi:MAG: prephenate dehydrogenase, partial [Gammaproteobacteria bacterium]